MKTKKNQHIDFVEEAFSNTQHGLEKESLRIDPQGKLAQTPHPPFLGAPLLHSGFSLDFAEAQIEMITQVHDSSESAHQEMTDLHHFLFKGLQQESLWPLSVPCTFSNETEIRLAHFGFSEQSYQKWLYRKGLSVRYGKAMQLLSGVHYSLSFQDAFWLKYHSFLNSDLTLTEFKSESYFHIIRNFLRMGWICSYLFGSSPVVNKGYPIGQDGFLKKWGDEAYYAPYGTSVRMSHLGYFSKIQSQNAISFNSLSAYLKDLQYNLKTSHPLFEELGLFKNEKQVQMNTHLLQIEAEHYTRIRPKSTRTNLRPSEALKHGVDYLETRILDVSPYHNNGIDPDSLTFIHLLILHCLFTPSPFLSKEDRYIVCTNQDLVGLKGRDPKLKLHLKNLKDTISVKEWGLEILESLYRLVDLLSLDQKKRALQVLDQQKEKLLNPELTPSARLLKDLKKSKSLTALGVELGKDHQKNYQSMPLKRTLEKQMKNEVKASCEALNQLEKEVEHTFCGYEDLEFSTQMLLKEAMRQNIEFTFYDRAQNLVRLKKEDHEVIVKQATLTPKDSVISYALMENKEVTKKLLSEHGLSVPRGYSFLSYAKASQFFAKLPKGLWVIKPNHTNMGQGIHFVSSKDKQTYLRALKEAFKMDHQVLVESFVKGDEYRFLVIGHKVIAVAKRIPAHVEGDGKHTIKELMQQKNKRNQNRTSFQKPLIKTPLIKATLEKEGYTFKTILKKKEKAFLVKNSNVSTGGESEDFTDQMPEFFKQKALQAAQAAQATFCGVDMLISKLSPSSKEYHIIELNFNPALFIHRFPTKGNVQYVEKAVLKELGF